MGAGEVATVSAAFAPLLLVHQPPAADGGTSPFSEVFRVDIDGGNLRQLSSVASLGYAGANVYRAAWAPDGQHIAFVVSEFTGVKLELGKLFWLDATEETPQMNLVASDIGYQSLDSGVAWSGDGSVIFHTLLSNGAVVLAQVSLDGMSHPAGPANSTVAALFLLPWQRMRDDALLSISNVSTTGDSVEKSVLNAWRNDQRITNISPYFGQVMEVARDGGAAFFAGSGNIDDPRRLYRIDLASGAIAELVNIPGGSVGQTVLSPDERSLAIASRAPLPGMTTPPAGNNLWLANSDGSELRPLTTLQIATIDSNSIRWSGDGKTIWALSARALDGSDQTSPYTPANIWAFDVESGSATPVTQFTIAKERVYEID